MGCEGSKNKNKEEIYLPGEQYLIPKKDINPNQPLKYNNNRDKVDLFFSLTFFLAFLY